MDDLTNAKDDPDPAKDDPNLAKHATENASNITAVADGGDAIITRIATKADVRYVYTILREMERSARIRGTGIARRSPQSICQKIYDGKAVIALTGTGEWVGFSYIEAWSGGQFVSNSGLIVSPAYRRSGVAATIKDMIFQLSRSRYPDANIFSITTGEAVMKMNARLGFEPVSYAEITRDEKFWNQCQHCVNYPKLESNERKICLCTAMMFKSHTETGLAAKKPMEKRAFA